MAWIHVQMVNDSVSAKWWKELIRHFANVGDEMEIRCWKEETGEISQAIQYGELLEDGNEVSIKGKVTYGTEIYLSGAGEDISVITKVLEPYGNDFSIAIGE